MYGENFSINLKKGLLFLGLILKISFDINLTSWEKLVYFMNILVLNVSGVSVFSSGNSTLRVTTNKNIIMKSLKNGNLWKKENI